MLIKKQRKNVCLRSLSVEQVVFDSSSHRQSFIRMHISVSYLGYIFLNLSLLKSKGLLLVVLNGHLLAGFILHPAKYDIDKILSGQWSRKFWILKQKEYDESNERRWWVRNELEKMFGVNEIFSNCYWEVRNSCSWQEQPFHPLLPVKYFLSEILSWKLCASSRRKCTGRNWLK